MIAALQGRLVQWTAYTEDDNTALQGRYYSEEHTLKMIAALQGRLVQWTAYTEDDNPALQGRYYSEEHTLKMTAALQGRHVQGRSYTEDDNTALQGRQCLQHTSNNSKWNKHHEAKSKPHPLKRVDIYDLTELTEVSRTSFRCVPFLRESVRFISRVFKLVRSWRRGGGG